MLYIKYPSYNDLVSLPENSIEYENIIDLASRCITKIYNSSEIIDVNRDQIEEVKNLLLNLFIGIFISVLVYYISHFSSLLGENGKLPIILSVWLPVFILLIISLIGVIKINEK